MPKEDVALAAAVERLTRPADRYDGAAHRDHRAALGPHLVR
jgi:hypothetical protein